MSFYFEVHLCPSMYITSLLLPFEFLFLLRITRTRFRIFLFTYSTVGPYFTCTCARNIAFNPGTGKLYPPDMTHECNACFPFFVPQLYVSCPRCCPARICKWGRSQHRLCPFTYLPWGLYCSVYFILLDGTLTLQPPQHSLAPHNPNPSHGHRNSGIVFLYFP